ncbi:hypothetical protein QQS21_007797 [Conoideocrella luteorostrata]|uniref:Uncharacterized protein n=1 Tax=Conoideocrella luteorostrata TaxID=1105319 RepID=A0AAJ0CPG2_9HYPO|nr:hypothetical protein QQS21_007797 [Conoideocrella luteorostrata]
MSSTYRGQCRGFCDESRRIASGYRGGIRQYDQAQNHSGAPACTDEQPHQGSIVDNESTELGLSGSQEYLRQPVPATDFNLADSTSTDESPPGSFFYSKDLPINTLSCPRGMTKASFICHVPTSRSDKSWSLEAEKLPNEHDESSDGADHETREFIASADELDFMQAFTDGVGIWMDSLDSSNTFAQVISWRALKSPLLLNALMACGAKHLSCSKPGLESKTTTLYNTATAQLVRMVQNPDRNIADCATASILLHVYEAMCQKPAHQMSHMAGARAQILKCGWNAASTGIAAACFWLSVGIEVLYCLSMNWVTTWNPDNWGLDPDWNNNGGETEPQVWVYRSFYTLAKVANYRAAASLHLSSDPHGEESRLSVRLAEWQRLKQLCDDWNDKCPRSMRPLGYLALNDSQEPSLFPRFWLARPAAMLGRMFYHTAQCILAQVSPLELYPPSTEMKKLQQHHAYQVLGVVASNQNKAMAIIAVHTVAVALASLVKTEERQEALRILEAVSKDISVAETEATTDSEPSTNYQDQWSKFGVDMGVLPMPDSWPNADSVATSRNNMDKIHGSEIPAVNPLWSAYFGHPGQPYKAWYRPTGEGAFK